MPSNSTPGQTEFGRNSIADNAEYRGVWGMVSDIDTLAMRLQSNNARTTAGWQSNRMPSSLLIARRSP